MNAIPPVALVGVVLWTFGCLAACAVVGFNWRGRRRSAEPGVFPGLLMNGLFLLALAPAVSAIQFVCTPMRLFWAGAGVGLVGAGMIAFSLAPKRARREPTLTFHEKSLIAQIATIVLVYGFVGFKLWGRPLSPPAAIAAVIGLSVLMIVIVTVSHIALAIHQKPEQRDERDAQVALRGARNGYYVLAVGLWFLMMLSIMATPYGQMLLAIMYVGVLAELVRQASQLVYYRRDH
jgi:hypothetical protein